MNGFRELLDLALHDSEDSNKNSRLSRTRFQDVIAQGASAVSPDTPHPFTDSTARALLHLISMERLIIDLSRSTRNHNHPTFAGSVGMENFAFNLMGISSFVTCVIFMMNLFGNIARLLQARNIIGVHAVHFERAVLNGLRRLCEMHLIVFAFVFAFDSHFQSRS